MNYTGGKYRILPQIMEYFPKDVNVMVDLFAGGCDVCSNFKANKIYANDINNYIIDIYKKMQSMPINDVLNYIDTTIKEFELSMYNQEAFLKFRQYYNQSQNKNPLDLYVLICYSFNYQFRFNNKHEFNSPFGRNRSSFNDTMRENLIKFHKNIQDIVFSSFNFKDFDVGFLKENDFLYSDPPYLISTGNYNDGKRGFEGWTIKHEQNLCLFLDKINELGSRFMLSYVLRVDDFYNKEIAEWAANKHYNVIDVETPQGRYNNRREVLITNY